MNSKARPGFGRKVLVLGNDTRSFLAVIRSLGRKGVEVHVSASAPSSPSLRSRYIGHSHNLPDYQTDPEAWRTTLRSIIEGTRFDLVIPCDDPSILRLKTYAARTKDSTLLELLPEDIQLRLCSKQVVHETAAKLGVPVPQSILVQNRDELLASIRTIPGPYVLKPIMSFHAGDTVNRHEVRKAFRSEQALSIGTELLQRSPIQVQRNFIGVGTGLEFLASHGEPLCVFQHVRIHEPLHGGGSSYRMGIPVHAGMRRAADLLIRELQYDGVGMFEFKWNRETDQFVLIELNARFWGSLPLAIASGADFPWFLFCHRIFGTRQFPKTFVTGICSRNLTQDADWILGNFRNDRTDPTLSTLPWKTVAKEFRTIACGRERIDTFALDDMRPFFAELRQWTLALESYTLRKAWRLRRQIGFLRRRRARVLKQRLHRAQLIEFVCYGNICRSPFAAAVASHLHIASTGLPKVRSSGTHAQVGRGSPDAAISAAQAFGVDLSKHRSEALTAERVDRADLIFVFDWSNLQHVFNRFPSARRKVFLIGELDAGGLISVEDPYGKSRKEFDATFRQIFLMLDGSRTAPS